MKDHTTKDNKLLKDVGMTQKTAFTFVSQDCNVGSLTLWGKTCQVVNHLAHKIHTGHGHLFLH